MQEKRGESIKKYRNEWKYSLTNGEMSLLKSRISEIMNLDPHTPACGRYIIHSLYFDDYKDMSVYTTDAGLSKRFKWRIRYYDEDLSYIVLERKEKLSSRCHKKSCRITIDEYKKIVTGNIADILYDTDKKLIKVINVRITFDMKISASYDLENFLKGNYIKYYINPSGMNVLEVKFDDILPSYIRKIVESYGFKQTSFSKYYYGRKIIDSYMR